MNSTQSTTMSDVREILAATRARIASSRKLCERSRDLVQRSADLRECLREYVLASRAGRAPVLRGKPAP
jgi:hypothetical protein